MGRRSKTASRGNAEKRKAKAKAYREKQAKYDAKKSSVVDQLQEAGTSGKQAEQALASKRRRAAAKRARTRKKRADVWRDKKQAADGCSHPLAKAMLHRQLSAGNGKAKPAAAAASSTSSSDDDTSSSDGNSDSGSGPGGGDGQAPPAKKSKIGLHVLSRDSSESSDSSDTDSSDSSDDDEPATNPAVKPLCATASQNSRSSTTTTTTNDKHAASSSGSDNITSSSSSDSDTDSPPNDDNASHRARRRRLAVELRQLKLTKLYARALKEGVEEARADEADNGGTPKESLIQLILDVVLSGYNG
jgi:hypothetical protein